MRNSSRLAAFLSSLVFLLAFATAATASSPTMVTAAGASGSCGTGRDLCVPTHDLFGPGPIMPPTVFSGAALGLVPGDQINSLSWGIDSIFGLAKIHFSVSSASVGAAGAAPDVFSEAAAGEAGADIFFGGSAGAPSPNSLFVDGDGVITLPAGPFAGLGLVEPPSAAPHDDLAGLASCNSTTTLAVGFPLFFTLTAASPTLGLLGASPASILVSSGGIVSVANTPASLGLAGGDVIDALVASGGLRRFSLASGSPTLGLIGAGGEDVLAPGAPPTVFLAGASLGLIPGDDLDALDMAADSDSDFVNDSCDNCLLLPNNDQGDADLDLQGDACDTCTDSDGDGFGNPGFPSNTCPDDNCPFAANPGQEDGDGDGVGNACDLCTNAGGLQNLDIKPKLQVTKINSDTTPGNDGFSIRGEFTLPGSTDYGNLDPATKGARIVADTVLGDNVLDVTLPAGFFAGNGTAGWSTNSSLTKWQFKDKTGSPNNGIKKMTIKNRNNKGPNQIQVVVKGKKGTYPVVFGDHPLFVTVVLGDQTAAAAGECTETDFTAGECDYNGKVDKLTCKRK